MFSHSRILGKELRDSLLQDATTFAVDYQQEFSPSVGTDETAHFGDSSLTIKTMKVDRRLRLCALAQLVQPSRSGCTGPRIACGGRIRLDPCQLRRRSSVQIG